jgi:hypothetical protein
MYSLNKAERRGNISTYVGLHNFRTAAATNFRSSATER